MDPGVASIRHVNIAVFTHSYPSRFVELSLFVSLCSPFCYELSVVGEFLDSVVASISHVDVAIPVHGYSAMFIELSIPRSCNSPLSYKDIFIEGGLSRGYSHQA